MPITMSVFPHTCISRIKPNVADSYHWINIGSLNRHLEKEISIGKIG